MKDKFQLLMNAVDDDLLEEAMTPVRKRTPLPWVAAAVAACLVLVMGLATLPGRAAAVTVAQLEEMGYEMKLPQQAEKIRYEIISKADLYTAHQAFEAFFKA